MMFFLSFAHVSHFMTVYEKYVMKKVYRKVSTVEGVYIGFLFFRPYSPEAFMTLPVMSGRLRLDERGSSFALYTTAT